MGGCDTESGSDYHAPPHAPHGTPAGPHPPPPPTRGRWVRFGPVAPLGRGHAGARRAGRPFLHFATALQAYAGACGAAGRRPRAPGAARRWGSRTQCEWVPCVVSWCNGALLTSESLQIVTSFHCNSLRPIPEYMKVYAPWACVCLAQCPDMRKG